MAIDILTHLLCITSRSCACVQSPSGAISPIHAAFLTSHFAHTRLNYFTGERKELEVGALKVVGKGKTRS